MEQPHNTVEYQKTLKKKGVFLTSLIALAFAVWLACLVFFPPDSFHPSDFVPPEATVDTSQPADVTTNLKSPESEGHEGDAETHEELPAVPHWYSVLPFICLLLSIAILPLFHKTEHWWENNLNRLMLAAGLGSLTLIYYTFLYGHGVHDHLTHTLSSPGIPAALIVLKNSLMLEYIPFITLLFCLYVITGGIVIESRVMGRPIVNTSIIGIGALLASFVGTTGAAMLLIRPLLTANINRHYVAHTVVFFIFAVCNTGGCLLPIGDPPLFLGFLKGVDFFWTLKLWPQWLFTNVLILIVYFFYDLKLARKERLAAWKPTSETKTFLRIEGAYNLIWLAGIVFCVATLDPSKPFLTTSWHAPQYFREFLMFLLTLMSLVLTPSTIRLKNTFNYDAILEVAALFSGIFVCMQAPVQILNAYGKNLGLDTPQEFFWGTGLLSSFLDNAPTYVVFFETAKTMEPVGPTVANVSEVFLIAISLGAVFMGAMTYIGNGPNFMVKAIAEKNNIRMPSFFGYMLYSFTVLAPIFLLMTWLFF